MISERCSILVLAAFSIRAMAADLHIVAVGAFGQPLQGCRVDSFRTAAAEGATRPQYSDRFQGLTGKQIPLGEYEVKIACGEAEIHKQLTLDHSNQFEVAALSGRQMISDHVKPKLAIKLDTRVSRKETWWVRFVGVYNGKTYTDRFGSGSNEATIIDPDPGSYLVMVSSITGYACVREVDFVESTNAWTFHPAGCSFALDQFAHLVQEEDKRNQKQGRWYEEMRGDRKKLRHAIDEALTKK